MKRIFAALLAIAMIVPVLCACGSTSGEGDSDGDYSYNWKLACAETEDYYMTQLAQKFLDRVEELTDGKVTGTVYANGQLGNLTTALEGLEMGNIDIVADCLRSLGAVNKLFDAWGLPYLYDDKDHQYRFWDQSFDECAEIVAEASNIRMVTVIDGLNRQTTCTRPINSFEDMKGLKIRVPDIPAYVRIWECFNTAPIVMSFSEVYTSIQTGVIEGQENDLPLSISSKLFEVCPYAVITDHVAYEGSLYFNDETFQSYPKELQEIILQAGQEIMAESRTMIQEQEETAMEQLQEMGITICYPDQAPFREATKVMYEEYDYVTPITDLIDAARS